MPAALGGTATIALAIDTNVAGWRAFYTGGATADSKSSSLAAAPATGVQALMVYQKDEYVPGMAYRRIYQGYDAYVIDGTTLLGNVAADYDAVCQKAIDSGVL
jgi:hypothetical protein